MARDIRAFMVSQAANIEAAVYEAQFENIQYPRLVPVVSEGNPWALAVERRTIEKGTGEAKRLSHLGDDWPNVDSRYGRLSVNVASFGAAYEVAEDDAAVAMMGGFDLSADKARLARRIVEEKLDELAREGDSTFGADKFYDTSIASTAAGGVWDAQITADKQMAIADDVNDAITKVWSDSKEVFIPDTLVLPRTEFGRIAGVQVPNTTMTLAAWIRVNNVYTAETGQPLNIVGSSLLGENTKDALLYRRDADVVRFHLPMPINVRGPEMCNYGLTMKYGVLARSAGVEWRLKIAAHRITGIKA